MAFCPSSAEQPSYLSFELLIAVAIALPVANLRRLEALHSPIEEDEEKNPRTVNVNVKLEKGLGKKN